MKIALIFVCLVCMIIIAFPLMSGADLGNEIVGENGIFGSVLNTISKVSSFFKTLAEKLMSFIGDVVDWFKSVFTSIKEFFEKLFNWDPNPDAKIIKREVIQDEFVRSLATVDRFFY